MRLVLFFLVIFTTSCVIAQKRTNLTLELGGSAGVASVNIERHLNDSLGADLYFRAGISGFPLDRNNGFVFVLPVSLGMLHGRSVHKLVTELGQGISVSTKGQFFSLATPVVGYRFERPGKRMSLQIAYTPLVSYWVDFQWQHWVGVTLAWRLKPKNKADEGAQ